MVFITTGYAQVTTELRHANVTRPAAIVYGVKAFSFTDADSLANTVQGQVNGHIATLFDSQVTCGPTTVRLGTIDDPILGISTTAPALGSRSGTATSPNVAVLVTKSTARGGRRGRGRFYLPWALQTGLDVDDAGIITAARLTAINTAMTAFKTGLNSNTIPMVILHSLGDSSPGEPDIVTALTAMALVATQRRRLGR